jgi:cGMP-dependent protein kinase
VSKSILKKAKHQAHILSEKDMLVKLNHPNVIALHATYKDAAYLYFLLECCLGGELFTVLKQHTCFENNIARFYVARSKPIARPPPALLFPIPLVPSSF